MDGHESALRQRPTQPDSAAIARETAWATDLTIAARPARTTITVQLEVDASGAGAQVRVASGGQTATATVGAILDCDNGPLVFESPNTGAVSIHKVAGAPVVTVIDEYTSAPGALAL